MAVSAVRSAIRNLYVVGGERLGKEFLASLVLPEGMRALLYLNLDPGFQPANLVDANRPRQASRPFRSVYLAQMLESCQQTVRYFAGLRSGQRRNVSRAAAARPPKGTARGSCWWEVRSAKIVILDRRIRGLAFGVVGVGLFLGLLMSWWGAARVTRPVRCLRKARAKSRKGIGTRMWMFAAQRNPPAFHRVQSDDEAADDQRERLIQAERVAAWRELARRLAHELNNPLFPLQTTVENLQRAREMNSDQFDEVFRESTGILLAEIENLKAIVGRFSDFSKMPQPELAPVNLNDIVRSVVKLFEGQFSAVGRPPITPELHLDEHLPSIQADATLLRRAIENLVLNAMDAMPAGGVLMLRTTHDDDEVVHLEISDTGTGLTPEECDRLFTPYYTTKQHGTGSASPSCSP